jgi:uncharacterized protein YggE
MKAAELTHQTLPTFAASVFYATHLANTGALHTMHRHLLAASLAIATLTAPALATDAPKRTLTLTGQAKVTAAPDMAVISAGTVSEAKTARAALDANNVAMAKVISTIEAAGVAKKDIQTSNFSVQPKYVYPKQTSNGEQQPPRIVGYTVSNSVSVIVRDLEKLGTIMDAVVSSGVNQMNGLSFTIAEPEPLRDEARKQAVAAALARAQLYAQSAGVKLGPILSISEAGGPRPPQPVARMAARAAVAEASVPIAQGEQSISASVNIVWGLE